jgi:ariadne-1
MKLNLINSPSSCELVSAWEKKTNSDSLNIDWMNINTKSCPNSNCKKKIEKNQGCNHMTCNKNAGGCGYEFCWICLDKWSLHGTSFYKCNFFDEKKSKENNSKDKIENLLDTKKNLEKFNFYFDRYNIHSRSLDHFGKLKNQINLWTNLFLEKNFCDIDFLKQGYSVVIEGLRFLKNTYIVGFFLKLESNYANLFLYNQNLLERNLDFLIEHLENEKKFRNIIDNDEFDSFNFEASKFRDEINDYSKATKKYISSLINEIKEKI